MRIHRASLGDVTVTVPGPRRTNTSTKLSNVTGIHNLTSRHRISRFMTDAGASCPGAAPTRTPSGSVPRRQLAGAGPRRLGCPGERRRARPPARRRPQAAALSLRLAPGWLRVTSTRLELAAQSTAAARRVDSDSRQPGQAGADTASGQ